jgi:hypothetical protein
MAFTARNSEIIRLTGICEKPTASVKTLQNEIVRLNVRLTDLEEGDPWGTKVEQEETAEAVSGRPPLKDRDQMELDREQILSFLSPRWIAIKRMLAVSTCLNDLQTVLFESYIAPKQISHRGLDILFNNADQLFLFISEGDRYKGDAIEIASAMAGVPEMEPRSSYDYFLAKRNRGKFKAQQVGAMKERDERISEGKKRKASGNPEHKSRKV